MWAAGETNDEARLRVAKQYLKQLSAAAEGLRSEDKFTSREANAVEADHAFSSAEEASEGGAASDDDASEDNFFQDPTIRTAMVEQIQKRTEATNVSCAVFVLLK